MIRANIQASVTRAIPSFFLLTGCFLTTDPPVLDQCYVLVRLDGREVPTLVIAGGPGDLVGIHHIRLALAANGEFVMFSTAEVVRDTTTTIRSADGRGLFDVEGKAVRFTPEYDPEGIVLGAGRFDHETLGVGSAIGFLRFVVDRSFEPHCAS